MTNSLDKLRRQAKVLQRMVEAHDAVAIARVRGHVSRPVADLKHADFLHVMAREAGFATWPELKFAAETIGLDRAARQQRLKVALYHGQNHVVEALLKETPDLADGLLGLQVALYDLAAVQRALEDDPEAATRKRGPRTPMLHLAYSRYIHARPELKADMLTIAELLLVHGADVNDSAPLGAGDEHSLSALYGAIGHANNMALGQWLLDHGADPNDGESLYHATELGHHDGLRMLLAAGAEPRGTNALLRAMDFHDHRAVQMLLDHGADADEFVPDSVDGEEPWVIPALHQAARRMSDRRMIDMLLGAGADPARLHDGVSAYGYARVFGNTDLARAIEAQGTPPALTPDEELLAAAAEGRETSGRFIDPARLPDAYRNILREILHLPGKLDHMKRLVALGLEYDRPDAQGVTPVQAAGWSGLPEVLGWLISQRPDLGHVNGYGGTLLGTIIHGSENCPERATRDHVACARLALEHGVALPRKAVTLAGQPDMAAFLTDWAAAYPGQVVEGD
ncbi:ankyrin repeat domain-containing protein [Actibacterium sp. XHP0104]|uniref:ankyrin repeat domain-containing protein n=1 Tax=Actibacterium sp. XHP0104 TaxID=2984335 RepID=UPI0021E73D42|nr:ankyrin repeat domain-containing protein [Actibacterium sp. XHP0104]MCV2882834.1 ankyrin repeat domain-containing protein [Actibacterium sp. XHP0104]